MTKQEGAPSRSRRVDPAVAMQVVLHAATCTIPEAAAVLGQSERVVREAVMDGQIASLRLARNIRVLCAPLRRQLGIEV